MGVTSKLKTDGKTLARYWAYEYMDVEIVRRYVMGMTDYQQQEFFKEVKRMRLESDADMRTIREELRKELFPKHHEHK